MRFGASFFWPELNDGLAHGHAPPFGDGPVDLKRTPLRLAAAGYVFGGLYDHVLSEIHDLAKIGIGLVELEHGELGIPAPAQSLVAKVAIDLVDPIKPPNGQALQVELGRDAQKKIHIQCVVMSLKRLRDCATSNGLHHRRFDFDEPMLVEIAPERLHQLAAL